MVGGTYYRDHLPPMTMEIKKTKGSLTTGDKVYVHVTHERLKQLSADHGGWNKDMEKVCHSFCSRVQRAKNCL